MSSFSNPHYMYLFELRNGKKKLGYGESPEDALEILRIRLSEVEMAEILPEQYEKINQRRLQEYAHLLGKRGELRIARGVPQSQFAIR